MSALHPEAHRRQLAVCRAISFISTAQPQDPCPELSRMGCVVGGRHKPRCALQTAKSSSDTSRCSVQELPVPVAAPPAPVCGRWFVMSSQRFIADLRLKPTVMKCMSFQRMMPIVFVGAILMKQAWAPYKLRVGSSSNPSCKACKACSRCKKTLVI